jgi:hypothetical protein
MQKVSFNTMHCRMGHPSKLVLQHAQKHTKDFPTIQFPSESGICEGCIKGKLPK